MALLLPSPTSASLSGGIHNEDTQDTIGRWAAVAASCMKAAGSTAVICCARACNASGGGKAVTGTVTLDWRRGDDYTILNTAGPNLTYHPSA